MTPTPLLKALVADRLGINPADWPALAATYGEALAPFAGLAPENELATATWRRQVCVDALGHLGTLQELQSWDLPFLVVKGVPWGARYWGGPTLRPAHDVDLIVTDDGAYDWQTRLGAAGYKSHASPLVWRRGRQVVQLHHPGSRNHWLHHVQPPWDAFWRQAVPVELGGVTVTSLDPADTLLYLAHHQVFQHGLDHPVGWLDLAGWADRCTPEWRRQAIDRAKGSHLTASLRVLNWIWQEVWGRPALLDLPSPGRFVRSLALRAWHRGDPWSFASLSFSLATHRERLALLRAAPAAWQRQAGWYQAPLPSQAKDFSHD